MFTPPFCPIPDCLAHKNPGALGDAAFFDYHGSYHPKCRARPVPRFRCRLCRKTFSRQTFRMDYCDNKPHLNATLFKLLGSGMGLRQSGRFLKLSRRCTELKARKISRHLGRVNRNLTDQFDERCRFQLDEMETFEGERAVLPLTLPMMIETNSRYVVASDVTTIKPSGQMSEARKKAIARSEAKQRRPRADWSVNALTRTFQRLRFFCRDVTVLVFSSDKKSAYGRLLRKFFGESAVHTQVSSREKRDQSNPLHFINVTNAMARDLCGRLRRRSWLVSKHRRYLRLQLHLFAAYKNFVRRRTNRDHKSPAQVLGFLPRRVEYEEILTWRQDWRGWSIHPLSPNNETIASVRARET